MDGTGLHAPAGELVRDAESHRVCCHLCGRWFVLLGAHVRVHGHTPDSYRELTGLCRTRALAAETLSSSVSTRQRQVYDTEPSARKRLAPGQQMARSGQLARLAAAKRPASTAEPLERRRGRDEQLAAGRAAQREAEARRLKDNLQALGAADLHGYLRQAYKAGASLALLARTTGLGRRRLRQAMDDAEVQLRPTGANTPAGRRSRALTAEARAAERLGVVDLHAWLRERRAEGWSLDRLGTAVGHSSHWVRWRLPPASGEVG